MQEAICPRCAMKDAPENVTFKCAACKATRHVSCFNPVTIRNWKDKKNGVEAHWMCYDCLHPQCGMCDTEAVYAVVHNSKAHKQDLFKHVREHSEAKTLIEARLKKHANYKFQQGQAVWFCRACKYPKCQDCNKSRVEKRDIASCPGLVLLVRKAIQSSSNNARISSLCSKRTRGSGHLQRTEMRLRKKQHYS